MNNKLFVFLIFKYKLMKKIAVLLFLFFGLLAMISCQKEADLVQKYDPVPVFTIGDYDNTNVEGVLGYMDPTFYTSISVQDSPYCPVILAGSYIENIPSNRGVESGTCVTSKKLCIILCMIPNNFQDFTSMSTSYGYDMYESTYRDLLVVCKTEEPMMQQGLFGAIGNNQDNEVVEFDMTGINAEAISYSQGEFVIVE